ncbi:MAG: tetratricopeptide repeat protein [Spirochaetaceae bacterium]|jgi:tetratricopeptide (TPR) repeat protein|nr:tetratricopeptide repeat protein [Spirochaetaceae bacterium]
MRLKRLNPGQAGLVFLAAQVLCVSCGASLPSHGELSRYAKARSVYAEGRFSEAAGLLLPLKSLPQALTLRGKALYFQGRLEEAEKALARARKIRPSSFEAGLYLARIRSEQGDHEAAGELVEGLLADDSENIRALRYASELAFLRDRPEDGFAFLERAAGAGEELSLVFLDRARFRWIRGDGEGALDDLEKASLLAGENSLLGRTIAGLQKTIKEKKQ